MDMEGRHWDAGSVYVLPERMRLPAVVDSLLLQYGLGGACHIVLFSRCFAVKMIVKRAF